MILMIAMYGTRPDEGSQDPPLEPGVEGVSVGDQALESRSG